MSSTGTNETNENHGDKVEEGKTERCFTMNKVYLISKGFYFFFFSAQGSLLPYLALFFKQLELPPSQIGAITGMKPYIAFFFIPFWGCVADRFKKGKLLFIISMIALISGMVAYALVPINICETEPTAVNTRGIPDDNKSPLYSPVGSELWKIPNNSNLSNDRWHSRIVFRDTRDASMRYNQVTVSTRRLQTARHNESSKLDKKQSSRISDLLSKISPERENMFADGLEFSVRKGRKEEMSLDGVSETADESVEETPWSQSDMIALQENSRKSPKRKNTFIFLYLLFATMLTTILSCPSLTLGDTATVNLLKQNDETHKYGKQRLWGSVGYGSMAFLIGTAISRTHLCPPGSARRKDVNYYPCFAMFVVYNIIALVIGSRFNFNNNNKPDTKDTDEDKVATNDTPANDDETKRSDQGIIAGLKLLTRPRHAMFLVTAFYVGITMGFIRVFLFWHLKDLGGTQILFSIMTGVNCVAEVTLYFLSTKLIAYIGTIRVLYLGLTCYAVRLFYYALVTNPWKVLPIELLSGITTAAVWAAMMSYVGTHSVEGASVTLQGKQ